jgi:hypothetical protein
LNHAPIPPDAAIPIERKRTLGESATQFAQGFGKGVRDETAQMYRDATELPHHVATTGRELLEDIQAGRKLRALAPIEALAHAIQNASREDVKKIAHAVVDGAIDFYNKSPQEKGEALGKATVSVATDVAIAAFTEGLGSVAALRKAEKALEAADHVKDAERAAAAAAATGRRVEQAIDHAEQAIPSRRAAFQSAKERAGVARSQSPDRQWTVGSDASRAGHSNYRLSDDAGSHGRYYEYETAKGTRVVVEHTSDPRAPATHFHAGQPKGDPARSGVDFQAERYQQVDGKHHIYYKK